MAERILIVDDDVDSLKLIGLMLQRNGYDVLVANAGHPALAKAETERPDLIILDVMMPDMDGLEVCRRLRGNQTTQDIPIIMFTAKTLIDDKVKGFEAGADDYLTKPTHPAELASRVKSILDRKSTNETEEPIQQQQGTAIGILGVKGGVGTSTVALNLTAQIAKSGYKTLLADFQLSSSTLGLMLGAKSRGMARLLGRGTTGTSIIEKELITHQSGLRALTCSSDPRELRVKYTVETALEIVQGLRTLGDPTIIDMGHGLTPLNQKLLPELQQLIVIIEPNNMALEMAYPLLKEIEADFNPEQIALVIVNRAASNLQTSWQDIENRLNYEVRAIISPAPELSFQALENKTPMVILRPDSVVAGQFMKLAQEMDITKTDH